MVTKSQAKKILSELREQHDADNWLRPNAPSWDEMHVRDTVGMTLSEFEQSIAADGYKSFEDFFIASLVDSPE